MKNFTVYNAVDGTSALKHDRSYYARAGRGNVVQFPSHQPTMAARRTRYTEVSYTQYAKDELSGAIDLLREGNCEGKSVNNVSTGTCVAIGTLLTLLCLAVILL